MVMEKGFSYWELPGEKPELYRHFGVRAYKKYLPTNGDLIRRKVWSRFGIGEFGGLYKNDTEQESLLEYRRHTKQNELLHLGSMSIIGYMQYKSGSNFEAQAAFSTVQVFGNIYPIMVQRYNRLRTNNLLKRIAERS